MHISELDFILSDADVDGVVASLRQNGAINGWHVNASEQTVDEPLTTIWGRFLHNPNDWVEAREEVSRGQGEIMPLTGPDGVQAAFVYAGPYRDAVLAAFASGGKPIFTVNPQLVEIRVSWALDVPSLVIGLDRHSRHSALLAGIHRGRRLIDTEGCWILPRGAGRGITEHRVAVEILDTLRPHATLQLFDTTEYAEHRDEALAVAQAVFRQQQIRQLQLSGDFS